MLPSKFELEDHLCAQRVNHQHQGGYVFGSVGLSVSLYVCWFVGITQNVMNGLGRNFMEGYWVVQ